VKGKGEMKTWYLVGRRVAAPDRGEPLVAPAAAAAVSPAEAG
jgi:hypothetical protein